MPKKDQSEDDAPFMTGGDWSTGLNSRTSMDQAELLQILGRNLQATYRDMLAEPLPGPLDALVKELDRRDRERKKA